MTRRGQTRVLAEHSQIEAVHLALLHTGAVVYYSGFRKAVAVDTETRVWHPKATDSPFSSPPTPDDLFCAGHAFLPDGRLLSTGGTREYRGLPSVWLARILLSLDPLTPLWLKRWAVSLQKTSFTGPTCLCLFDPQTERWELAGEMQEGRWYPTNTALPDGGILILSGQDSGVEAGTKRDPTINQRVEVYYAERGLVQHGLIRGPGIRLEMAGLAMRYGSHRHIFPTEYPRLHVLPLTHLSDADRAAYHAGRVFCAGYGPETKMLNLDTWEWEHVDDLRCEHPRHDGNSVLLPLSYEDDYRARVLTFGGSRETVLDAQAMHSAESIDFSEPDPQWRFLTDPLSNTNELLYVQGRVNGAAVLLPDGKVMAVGGNQTARWDDPVYAVDVFDPQTDTWDGRFNPATGEWESPNTPITVPRGYHATALLLPDATVLASGTTPAARQELRMEVYAPYYLDGDPPRPAIQQVKGTGTAPDETTPAISYAGRIEVRYSAPGGRVTRAALIRPGAMTHAFDMEQRHVWLRVTGDRDGSLSLEAPPDPHVAPPGYYMLFLLDEAGVPSEAAFVWLPVPSTGSAGGSA